MSQPTDGEPLRPAEKPKHPDGKPEHLDGKPEHLDGKRGVAAFDFDGTITSRDCVVPFLRAVNGTWPTVAGLVRRAGELVPALLSRDRDRVKAIAAAVVFTGRPIADVDESGRRFADAITRSWLRDDAVAILREHQRRGHEVVVVSASFASYLRPLGAAVGTTEVLATELEVDDDGYCSGALDGGNCRGEEKVARLHEWLERYGGRANVELWAYGDSAGDHALLADADHPVWRGPARRTPAGMRIS